MLNFANELILDGRKLPRPANYGLVRIVPPEGAVVDPAKPPIVVVDPRAGHRARHRGHEARQRDRSGDPRRASLLLRRLLAEPMPGQTIEDVCRAEAALSKKSPVDIPTPRASRSSSPIARPGWQTMMTAAIRPDIIGPIVVAGAPMSYWAGVRGKNPMRYSGGVLGGTWLTALSGDLAPASSTAPTSSPISSSSIRQTRFGRKIQRLFQGRHREAAFSRI